MNYKKLLLPLLLCFTFSYFSQQQKTVTQNQKGNLALPAALQPGPLFSLGQNIIDKHDLLIFETYGQINGQKELAGSLITDILYGITDDSSLLFEIPIITELKINNYCSSGVCNMRIQGEVAIYLIRKVPNLLESVAPRLTSS